MFAMRGLLIPSFKGESSKSDGTTWGNTGIELTDVCTVLSIGCVRSKSVNVANMKTELLARQPATAASSRPDHSRVVLTVADACDRDVIYRLRHEVYACELGQHSANSAHRLRDALDDWNIYLVAKIAGRIAGFISLTTPGSAGYSIDKYVERDALPFPFDDRLYEIRLLTVLKPHRGSDLATLLMYAAFRWVEAHGGTRVVAIGRREVVAMYLRCGLHPVGLTVQSGAVTYDFLQASPAALRERMNTFGGLLDRLEGKTDWQLNFPFRKPASCFHGGAFFDAIGPKFNSLERSRMVINADVLDAWFPPSPKVLAALQEHLPWLLRTSPPTDCEGLIEIIAQARGVTPENVLPGAGSSDLIFRALRQWLTPVSNALILNPTYGEYAHVLERVVGCTVDRLTLSHRNNFEVDLVRLEAALNDNYDLVVLVNPNSPTGCHIPRAELERVLRCAPARTRIWVDETYVEYAGAGQSLESFAVRSENVIVCKSMSKVYALSGARAAYLCAGPHQLEELRAITPPWVVSLPAQVAAVRALQDPDYYAARYIETAALREQLAAQLRSLGLEIVPGIANFILCHLPAAGPDAATVVKRCRAQSLFLRDAAAMGSQLGSHALRIAVKDAQTNRRMVAILSTTLSPVC
jgi:histidinol-phosphate/aromatic aminotransferase/cobyric acid decarboxylase-like protein/GNAT superfamily N-acetyltransferase